RKRGFAVVALVGAAQDCGGKLSVRSQSAIPSATRNAGLGGGSGGLSLRALGSGGVNRVGGVGDPPIFHVLEILPPLGRNRLFIRQVLLENLLDVAEVLAIHCVGREGS